MPVIENPKHELFAQAIAKGDTGRAAYKAAGFAPKTNAAADAGASRLLRDVKVAARSKELLGEMADLAKIDGARVLDELGKIAFANMLDFIRVGPDGLPYTDFSDLTREQAAAIGEIVVETTPAVVGGDGEERKPELKKVRFKLADKLGALRDLAKHLGLFKEQEHSRPIQIHISEVDARL